MRSKPWLHQRAAELSGDGSGVVIVELPTALLEKLGLALGDELVIEDDKEGIPLKLKPRSADAAS